MTSSQAHKAFDEAIHAFKNDTAWQAVAFYLYGDNWRDKLNVRGTNDVQSIPSTNCDQDHQLQSLFDYARQLSSDYDKIVARSHDKEAIRFIVKYVTRIDIAENDHENMNEIPPHPGIQIQTEDQAKFIVDSLEKQILNEVGRKLQNHVCEDHRVKTKIAKKQLMSWLLQDNYERQYFCYNAKGLKELVEAKGLQVQGQRTKEKNREVLVTANRPGAINNPVTHNDNEETSSASVDEEEQAIKNASKAILEKSFLPHRKGKLREYCTLGHQLETPILKNWIKVFKDRGIRDFCEAVEVRGAYSAGLAAKRDADYAKDSVDFVLTMKKSSIVATILNDDDDDEDFEVWGFESKGRVTPGTAAQEERDLNDFNNPHISIDDEEVHEAIHDVGERFQVLQHAYVYDFEKVVLAIGDNQSDLIRSILITFSDDLKSSFGAVLKKLKDISLSWAYPEVSHTQQMPKVLQISNQIKSIADSIPAINGIETLQGTANIWHSMRQLPKPIPSFVRFIPAVCAYWNAVKGGSDTTTKLMDDCIVRIPKVHLNHETVAINRLISLTMVLVHRVNQTFTAKKDPNFYDSLQDYRKASSQRSTFFETLLSTRQVLIDELNNAQANHEASPSNEPNGEPRRNPSRRRVAGVVPQQTEFGASLSMKTPKRIGKQARTGTASSEVQEMIQNCTGIPMKTFPLKYGRCSICAKKTAWYCAGCKRWFCMDGRDTNERELYSHNVKDNLVTFRKVCYHIAHEDRWCTLANDDNNNASSNPQVTP